MREEDGGAPGDPELREIMLRAGWFSGRDEAARVEEWCAPLVGEGHVLVPAAREVLAEFGGLYFQSTGPGRDCGRSSVVVDPMTCPASLAQLRSDAAELALSAAPFPVGEATNGVVGLFVAEDERVFAYTNRLEYFCSSFDIALESLLLGIRPHVPFRR